MADLQAFEELVASARREPAPRVDVVDRVRASLLQQSPGASAGDAVLGWFSGAAAAAAVLALSLGWQAWQTVQDPALSFVHATGMLTP